VAPLLFFFGDDFDFVGETAGSQLTTGVGMFAGAYPTFRFAVFALETRLPS